MRALVPKIGMTEVIYHKNIYILLVDNVTLTVYKVVIFNIKSPLMKTLDRSVETLVVNAIFVWWFHSFNKTRVALFMSDQV